MHSEGNNLASFNPDLAECVNTEVYRIDDVEYKKQVI